MMNFLACQYCNCSLSMPGGEIGEGAVCPKCGRLFRFQNGVWLSELDFANEAAKDTIEEFGRRWMNVYDKMGGLKEFFLPTIHPVEENFFSGKIVLDAGGGFGRLSKLMLDYGARHVVLLDGSTGVLAAADYLKEYKDRLTIIRGDLLQPPIVRQAFDVVLCHGVLHHTGDPNRGVASLACLLKPTTGTFILWVYAKEGNRFMSGMINACRGISLRVSDKMRWRLASCIDLFLRLMTICIYRPLDRCFSIKRRLWYGEYFIDFLFAPEINNRMDRLQLYHDFLTSKIIEYYSKDQIEEWLNKAGFRNISFSFYRQQSWSVAASFDINEDFKGQATSVQQGKE